MISTEQRAAWHSEAAKINGKQIKLGEKDFEDRYEVAFAVVDLKQLIILRATVSGWSFLKVDEFNGKTYEEWVTRILGSHHETLRPN